MEGDPPTVRIKSKLAGEPIVLTHGKEFVPEKSTAADYKQCPYCKSTIPLKDEEYKCSHCGHGESAIKKIPKSMYIES